MNLNNKLNFINLEHLAKIIINDYFKLKNPTFAIKLFIYYYLIILKKKKKLRLGKIVFEIKEIKYYNILIWSTFEMRYINQDTTVADEQKLENLVKRYEWKWNFNNIFSLICILSIIIIYIFKFLKKWYKKNLALIFFRELHYDYLIRYTIETVFSLHSIGIFNMNSKINLWTLNAIIEFCLYFDILF